VARTPGLVVRDLGNETLVYDAGRHEAHCLNRTASLVFRHADGRRSAAEIAAALAADEEVVRLALRQLAEARLLDGGTGPAAEPTPAPPLPASGRREALRRVGLGAALLAPVVTSLLVPTPAEAANTCIQQAACTAAKYGQPCYVGGTTECTSKICIDDQLCQ
jgi:hypothetical protein